MLAKAATGSEKNIVPKRLITRSKRAGSKSMNLGVAELEGHVVEPLGLGELAGVLEHSLGDVDADHAAGRGGARRVTGG